MRSWISKPQSVTSRTLYAAAFLRLQFYPSLQSNNFFYLFMGRSFRFYLPLDLSPIAPHIKPVEAASLSLCTCLSPPISPGRRATVHLDGAPACWPPPLVCALLPSWTVQRVPCASLCIPYFVGLPSLCRPWLAQSGPCRSQVSPVQESLPPYACLHHPHARPTPPPLPDSTGGPVPW